MTLRIQRYCRLLLLGMKMMRLSNGVSSPGLIWEYSGFLKRVQSFWLLPARKVITKVALRIHLAMRGY